MLQFSISCQTRKCMKNNASIIYNVSLLIGDAIAITAAFTVAYILRVTLSHRALSAHVSSGTYITIFFSLLPFWLIIFALLGLYTRRIYESRFNEVGRIFVGSVIGILFIISYSYLANVKIFPARLVTVYAFLLSFGFVIISRTLIRGTRRQLFRYGHGITNVLIVGDTLATERLIEALKNTDITGQKVLAVVAGKKHCTSDNETVHVFNNFSEAVNHLKHRQLHSIIQTELYSDSEANDEILSYAQQNHIAYGFVPGNSELFIGNIEADLFHSVPIIAVHQTALIGWGRVVKRTGDIIFGLLFFIIASPFMLIIAILQLFSGSGSIFFRQDRLTRYNRTFKVFKFRSQYKYLDGTTPEEAFTKLGREDLIEPYRKLGDQLPNDPRVTRFGKFLRRNSLDELPQLINVIKGDISLVGPRALVPYELDKHAKKNIILSVRSGLTGLAQISGVANLSFEERRKLNIYYVENWSFWGDLVIMAKTFWVVLTHKGTRL